MMLKQWPWSITQSGSTYLIDHSIIGSPRSYHDRAYPPFYDRPWSCPSLFVAYPLPAQTIASNQFTTSYLHFWSQLTNSCSHDHYILFSGFHYQGNCHHSQLTNGKDRKMYEQRSRPSILPSIVARINNLPCILSLCIEDSGVNK